MRPLLVALALLTVLAPPASATELDRLGPARTALALTDERLGLMRGVMATKWVARTPIEDRAQEEAVLAGARAAAVARGLDPDAVAAFFAEQIAAAKEVQLGWGGRWLLHGFPPDDPVPDLAAVRARLAALTPAFLDALERLGPVRCARGVRARLLRVAARRIDEPFVTAARRRAIVDRLLAAAPAPARGACR